ncbi:MAG: DUF2304 domain-containing protein [Nanoarchaeota archaeon]|nr:DUF2304 domain-containing protein [Nanoarchaeota archaeon]
MINVFIIIFATIILGLYILYRIFSGKRLHVLYEISLLKIYVLVMVLSLFPQILEFIELSVGVVNVVLAILVIWILVLFVVVFEMYRVVDFQRQEMTKLVREVAFLKFEIKSNFKNDSSKSDSSKDENKKSKHK